MAISRVSQANAAVTASRSPSLTFVGLVPQENDVVAFWVASTTAAAAMTVPSGWANPLGANVNVASDSHTQACVYHLVTAAEATAVTIVYTATNLWNANQTGNVVGAVMRGTDLTAPVNTAASTFSSANAATPHVLPALTGTKLLDGSVVLGAVAKDTTGTYTTPGGWTAVTSSNTNQGHGLFQCDTTTTAGTTFAATNVTPSAGDEYCGINVAFSEPIPLIGTLTETFDTKDEVKWFWDPPSDVSAGQLVLSPSSGNAALIKTIDGFNLVGSSVYCEMTNVTGVTTTGIEVKVGDQASGSTHSATMLVLSDGNLQMRERINSVNDDTTITYNATDHKWLRMRVASGTIYWETSPNGTDWTERRSKAVGQTYAPVWPQLQAAWASGTPAVNFDNVNTAGGPATQDIAPSGIATAEAFGSTTVTPGPVDISPTGIASTEAFGTASIAPLVEPTGITSAEAFGTARVDQQIVATGIASAEALGTAVITLLIEPTGIASAEVFGTSTVAAAVEIAPTGITSIEAFGTATIALDITPTGIGSLEAFGTPTITPGAADVLPSSIGSAEVFGTASIGQGVSPTAIGSAEAFGTATVIPGAVDISPTGIASTEALGTPTITLSIAPTGIASAEAFGTTAFELFVVPTDIASAQAFGTATITLFVEPTGIASAEVFGSASVGASQGITPTGIASTEAFGATTITTGSTDVSPTGIASAEAFGSALIALFAGPTGIASAEGFGTAAVSLSVAPTGIASGEIFGIPTITLFVAVTGIPSGEVFGTATLGLNVSPVGIASAEMFGAATINTGPVDVSPTGIASTEAFGTTTVVLVGFITPQSISSQEAFGVIVLDIIIETPAQRTLMAKPDRATVASIQAGTTQSSIQSREIVHEPETRIVER